MYYETPNGRLTAAPNKGSACASLARCPSVVLVGPYTIYAGPYVGYDEYRTFAAWQLADLSLFPLSDQSWGVIRHALNPSASFAGNWVEQRVDPPWKARGDVRVLGVQVSDVSWTP